MPRSALEQGSGMQATSARSARLDAQATCIMRFASADNHMGVAHNDDDNNDDGDYSDDCDYQHRQ